MLIIYSYMSRVTKKGNNDFFIESRFARIDSNMSIDECQYDLKIVSDETLSDAQTALEEIRREYGRYRSSAESWNKKSGRDGKKMKLDDVGGEYDSLNSVVRGTVGNVNNGGLYPSLDHF